MKKVTAFFLGAVFSVAVLGAKAFAADKFAFINLNDISGKYEKAKDYEKDLTAKFNLYKAETDKKVTDIKQFQDKINLLSEKEKDAKKAELETKIKALQEYDRQKKTDLQKEQFDKMQEVGKDIEDAVKKYAEKEGITLVFDDRFLIYQDKKMDITDKVTEILNSGYKKKQ